MSRACEDSQIISRDIDEWEKGVRGKKGIYFLLALYVQALWWAFIAENIVIRCINKEQRYIYLIKGSVTVGYIFVNCRFISLFAKIQ